MGNPDGATPRVVVASWWKRPASPRNHRYSVSKGIPNLRQEIVKRYERNYGVQLDPEKEAIVTIGAKDALAHLLFAVIGPGDAVVLAESLLPHPPIWRDHGRRRGLHAAHARSGRVS